MISERPINQTTLLAIDEINAHGGLLGRKIEPVVLDGESDWPTFARAAQTLISRDHVDAIFGCYTSASSKTNLRLVINEEWPMMVIMVLIYVGGDRHHVPGLPARHAQRPIAQVPADHDGGCADVRPVPY